MSKESEINQNSSTTEHDHSTIPIDLIQDAIPIDYPGFAKSTEDAIERHKKTYLFDPFPDIAPSLLSAADIYDYVRLTGMLHPFEHEKTNEEGKLEALKSASYEAPIGQKCIYWNPKEPGWKEVDLREVDSFTLEPNSIAFVQIKPRIRLPAYIALRFNLRIKHVHRGILLGTGPLVDPGFDGDLLIPLHNLTTNPYIIKRDEGLIWIEFTKTTVNEKWDNPSHRHWKRIYYKRHGGSIGFTITKNDKDPFYYLGKAFGGNSIQSSIPVSIIRAQSEATEARIGATNAAKSAEQAAKKAKKSTQIITAGAIITLLIALIGAIITYYQILQPTYGLVQDSRPLVQTAITMYQDQYGRIVGAEKTAGEAQKSANDAQSKVERAEKKTQELENKISILQKELELLSKGRKNRKSQVPNPEGN